jgi:O-antigen ligase
MNPLGGNHHALAELMVLVAPLALVLAERVVSQRCRFALRCTAGLFWLVAVLTFARAAWLVVALQVSLAGVFLWRDWLRRHLRTLTWVVLLASPLLIYMLALSFGPLVAQSTSARSLLLDVAWSLFRDHPLVGVGAGTFPERLSHIWAFTVEFGASQDAHGLWQKVAAETGLFGLIAIAVTLWSLATLITREWQRLTQQDERAWFSCLCLSVVGSLTYQIFSTSLWSTRVWLSVGLFCAGMRLLRTSSRERDPDFLRT